jgi:hypothetical protein
LYKKDKKKKKGAETLVRTYKLVVNDLILLFINKKITKKLNISNV